MAAAGLTAYKLFRSLWPQKSINESLFEQFPELGLLPKDTTFYEKYRYIDVGLGAPQGIGPVFTGAKKNKSASTAVEFQNSTQPYYALFSIEGDLMRRAKSDKALLVDPIKRESRNAILQWKLDVSRYLHGNGGGALGQIATTTTLSSQVIQLTNIKDIRFFRVNMVLNSSVDDGTGGGGVRSGQVTVANVNRRLGQITIKEASISGALVGVTNNGASNGSGDYLFRDQVYNNVIPGFEAWNPASDPTSTLFRGVDRSVDTDLLGGLRIDGRKKTPRAALKMACNAAADMGGNPNLAIYSTDDWANLEADLDSAGSLVRTQVASSPLNGVNFGVTYEALKFMGPMGPVAIVASPNCPTGVARVLTKEICVLGCMGELLHPIDENDVEDAADAKEFRMLGDIDFYMDGPPGWCARLQLA